VLWMAAALPCAVVHCSLKDAVLLKGGFGPLGLMKHSRRPHSFCVCAYCSVGSGGVWGVAGPDVEHTNALAATLQCTLITVFSSSSQQLPPSPPSTAPIPPHRGLDHISREAAGLLQRLEQHYYTSGHKGTGGQAPDGQPGTGSAAASLAELCAQAQAMMDDMHAQ
jgi:hypothetical protein